MSGEGQRGPAPAFRPLPVPDRDSAPFWEACREHRLVAQRCQACDQLRFPPSPVCHHCRSWEFTWSELSGEATVYSWVVVHHPVLETFVPEVPFVVALVEVAPGVRMPTRLRGVDPGRVQAGMRVAVVFNDVADSVSLPEFQAAG